MAWRACLKARSHCAIQLSSAVSPKGATAHGCPVELVFVAQQIPLSPFLATLRLLCLIRCVSAKRRLACAVRRKPPSSIRRAGVVGGSLTFSSQAASVLRGSGSASQRSRGPSGLLNKACMSGLHISSGTFWICACLASQPSARITCAGVHMLIPLSCWFPSLQSCKKSTMLAVLSPWVLCCMAMASSRSFPRYLKISCNSWMHCCLSFSWSASAVCVAGGGLAGRGRLICLPFAKAVCMIVRLTLQGGVSKCSLLLLFWRLFGGAFGWGCGLPGFLWLTCRAAALVGVGGAHGLPQR